MTVLDGDFNNDSIIDASDIDLLTEAVRSMGNDKQFDLNDDGVVDSADRTVWVEGIHRTYFGDADLDGEFSSSDFVLVFAAGEYEDDVPMNSTWEEGDWNGDGDFSSRDFVTAFNRADTKRVCVRCNKYRSQPAFGQSYWPFSFCRWVALARLDCN